jgi:hypothetical protein
LSWLLAVPLVLGGAQLAHAVDYWLIAPDAHERSELLAGSGHGYFSYLPFAAALLAGLAVASFVAISCEAHRGRTAALLDYWPLAFLPFATFVVQEHLERYLHDGAFPWTAVAEPTFLVGFFLQIPFAVAAFVAARLLMRVAQAVGRLTWERARSWPDADGAVASPVVHLPRVALLTGGPSARSPPAASSV